MTPKRIYPPTIDTAPPETPFLLSEHERLFQEQRSKDLNRYITLARFYFITTLVISALLFVSMVYPKKTTPNPRIDYFTITNLMNDHNEEWSISKLDGTYYVAGDNVMGEGETLDQAHNNYTIKSSTF